MYKFNAAELKVEFLLKGFKTEEIMAHLGIKPSSASSYYKRMRGEVEFSPEEMSKLIDLLKLDGKKAVHIFFNNEVS